MWLATKYGFYSIVKSSVNSDYVVRSRDINDLINLKKELKIFKNRKIHSSEETDYKYRIFVNFEEFNELMQLFTMNVDYSNFKDKIKVTPNQKDKLPFYSKVWRIMCDYQYRHYRKQYFDVFYQ